MTLLGRRALLGPCLPCRRVTFPCRRAGNVPCRPARQAGRVPAPARRARMPDVLTVAPRSSRPLRARTVACLNRAGMPVVGRVVPRTGTILPCRAGPRAAISSWARTLPGPCRGTARLVPCRAVPVPCFLTRASGQPDWPGPRWPAILFGTPYTSPSASRNRTRLHVSVLPSSRT